MITLPLLKVWTKYPTKAQLDEMKSVLPTLHAPELPSAKVTGIRICVDGWEPAATGGNYKDFCDYVPENIWRIEEGFKRLEYILPAGCRRLVSLPVMDLTDKPISTVNAGCKYLRIVFDAMEKAGITPEDCDYHLNEQYAGKYRACGMTAEAACAQAIAYRQALDCCGLESKKLYLCCQISTVGEWATWKAFQELRYKDRTFPRDVHLWDDPSPDTFQWEASVREYCIAKQYQDEFICTEAGQWDLDVPWGVSQWFDPAKNTTPLRGLLDNAALLFGEMIYYPIFFNQTLPAAGATSPGLWSNSEDGSTPKRNPIWGYVTK